MFVKLPDKSNGGYHIFKSFGETVMTSLLICNYMKTFDNPETDEFMKKIKDFCDFDKIYCGFCNSPSCKFTGYFFAKK